MTKWIERLKVNLSNEITPCCGGDSIIKLDGRLNKSSITKKGLELTKENKYAGFIILIGESILNSRPNGLFYIKSEYLLLKRNLEE